MVNRDDVIPASGRLLIPADLVDVPSPGEPDPLVSPPLSESPPISARDAGRVLCELFLTNAERGHNAVNDELLVWITLSRVAEGSVTQQGGRYLDGDAPLPPYLAASVPTLLTEGSLVVADPDPAGCHQLTLTAAGQSRYEELRRRAARGVEQ